MSPAIFAVILALFGLVGAGRTQGATAFSRRPPQRRERIEQLEKLLHGRQQDPKILMALGKEFTLLYHDSHEVFDHDQAKRYLEKTLFYRSNEPEPRGWLALLTGLQARDMDGITAKSTALSSLDSFDRLIEADGKNPLIRVLRALFSMGVPRTWGRLDQALDDLLLVEYAVKRDPAVIEKFGLDLAMVYLKLGKIYLARSDRERARDYLEKATKGPDPYHAQKAGYLLTRHFPVR